MWFFRVVVTEGENCCDHDTDDTGRLFVIDCADTATMIMSRTIVDVVGGKELLDDEGVHPAEEAPKDDAAGNDLRQEFQVLALVNHIGTFAKDAETHVQHTKDDGHLHLDAVDEGQFVLGGGPRWVLAEWVHAPTLKSPPDDCLMCAIGGGGKRLSR